MTHDCDKCDKSFGSEDALEQHKQDYDHSKLQECPDCGDTFTSDAAYKDHRKTHRNTAQEFLAATTKTHLVVGVLALVLVGGFFMFSGSTSSPTGNTAVSGETGIQPGMTAPDATLTTVDGEQVQLSDYQGEKVMLWIFATWCPSCQRGAQVLQQNNDQLQDMKVLAVKTNGNAGRPGASPQQFAQRYAPSLLQADNWVWGTLSQQSTSTFNPRNRPDLIYLIDEDGTIQARTAAPAAVLNQITQFAQVQDTSSQDDRPGESYKIQGRQHVQPGQNHPAYNSNPPTSGWHYGQAADWGFYNRKLPDERAVHNIEHGGIWISYTDNASQTAKNKLRSLAQQYPKSVIVTKRNANDAPIAVASWGRLMELQQFDKNRITTFIEENMNNSPEPFAGQ